jgi:hypothetical protein
MEQKDVLTLVSEGTVMMGGKEYSIQGVLIGFNGKIIIQANQPICKAKEVQKLPERQYQVTGRKVPQLGSVMIDHTYTDQDKTRIVQPKKKDSAMEQIKKFIDRAINKRS